MTPNPRLSSFLISARLAAAFLALLMGSGFATGQEALQFFAAHGLKGVLVTALCVILFVYSCAELMLAGKRHGLQTNEESFRHFCGKALGSFLSWYTMIFIVAVHAVMVAGAGATLHEAYGLPQWAGSGAMAAFTMITVLLGLRRIVDVLSIAGPAITFLTIVVAIASFAESAPQLRDGFAQVKQLEVMTASGHWLWSGVLYVCLTLPGMACFLPALGATAQTDAQIRIASVIGPLIFMCTMALVILALLANIGEVYDAQVPMLALASGVLPLYGSIFAAIVFIAIYTTVTPLLWSLCERFANEGELRYTVLTVGLSLLGFIGGTRLPFDKLINLIYPTVAYAGVLFLGCVVLKTVKRVVQR